MSKRKQKNEIFYFKTDKDIELQSILKYALEFSKDLPQEFVKVGTEIVNSSVSNSFVSSKEIESLYREMRTIYGVPTSSNVKAEIEALANLFYMLVANGNSFNFGNFKFISKLQKKTYHNIKDKTKPITEINAKTLLHHPKIAIEM